MAILAAAVCTRSGKVLLSRQFEPLSAERVQELFSNFPKLAQSGSQHTTAEDESVRYVYEPLEELYVVVVTDLQSNILQDIRTLRLVSQVVKTFVPGGSEREVGSNAFELISAFDEIVSLGYPENLTLTQVETFLDMESHEEKIQEIIERNKELEAAEERKKKARQLEQQRRATRTQNAGLDSTKFSDGMSSPFEKAPVSSLAFDSRSGGLSNTPSGGFANTGSAAAPQSKFNERKSGASRSGRGLQLGKKKPTGSEDVPLLAELERPGRTKSNAAGSGSGSGSGQFAAAKSDNPPYDGVEVSIVESLIAELGRDGSVHAGRVSGALNLLANKPEQSKLRIKTAIDGPVESYKTHPKMDRALFARERVLGLKNADESFPQSETLLVKWMVSDIKVPITFTVWISHTSDPGFMSVTLEYELAPDFQDSIENLSVTIPLPTSNAHVLDPSSIYDQADDNLDWMVPLANHQDGHGSGSFEFTAEADSEDSFFPMAVSFKIPSLSTTFGGLSVTDIVESSGAAAGTTVDYITRTFADATASYSIR